ncbi:enoyl-CoA hydratase/isomerase family protein [Nocardiopsis sp. ATB16-24]|uniref:enoyl-CoA hydratase/isomerase family protein n=1 Tax=Nocardiopsis sp. ATB16-24 TaxID=3019555 RepID=UPI0025533D0D|nr:enoyl-CoA hydratase/isomerase family protein [Nocardiopsis sp. ATB16-24]
MAEANEIGKPARTHRIDVHPEERRPGTVEGLAIERKGPILILTLDRPQLHNAISFAMWDELARVLSEITYDRGIRAVLLKGNGRSFCSGTDIGDLGTEVADAPERRASRTIQRMRTVSTVIESMTNMPKPIIAAVNGVAAGAGMGLALAADLIVAGRGAWFKVATVSLGSMPDAGIPMQLHWSLGMRRTKQICLLDERIDVDSEEGARLVNWVVPEEEVDGFALSIAERVTKMPQGLAGQIKKAVNALPDRSLVEHLMHEGMDVGTRVQDSGYIDEVERFMSGRGSTVPKNEEKGGHDGE